uniref:Histone-lysine N-methyltransferase n=1 Tax=Caenorhabditis tropicalis TaxID=1561998 RepID=A0A1I7TLB4_9PELO
MTPSKRADGIVSTIKIGRCRLEHNRLSSFDEIALAYIKKRKKLFMKNGQPTRDQYEEMKMEIEKKGREKGLNLEFEGDGSSDGTCREIKKCVEKKMRSYIVKRRMEKMDMERALCGWKIYDTIKFFRNSLEEDEKKMWEEHERLNEMGVEPEEDVDEEQEEEEENGENVPPDSEEELNEMEIDEKPNEEIFPKEIVFEDEEEFSLPDAIVMNKDHMQLLRTRNVKIVPEYIQKVPYSCSKSIAALHQGTVTLPGVYPGVPNKKFEAKNLMNLRTWPSQTAFENREKQGHWIVLLEAVIEPFYCSEEILEMFSPEALNKAKNMVKFYESLEAGALGNDFRFGLTPLFRHFEDVSFIHSKIHEKFGMGRVTYMAFDQTQAPPLYQNTPVNLMSAEVYKACMARKENKPFVMKESRLDAIPQGCENPDGCKCNEKFEALYKRRCNQNLQPNSEGLLDLSMLDEALYRILIECSDDCGCSLNCPRRQVQRRKTPPTVVFHAGDIGYTLRTLAKIVPGQYIGEYTGWVKFPKAGDDQTYEASVEVMNPKLVICARRAGSVVRFMSHSCDPSAVFIVTHSREKETDLLIPRLAVFALKEMNIGDPITIKYYIEKDLIGVERSIKCLCGSSNCIGYLPG